MPASAILIMHGLESLLGHDWVAVYGPAVAALIAVGGAVLLTRSFTRRFESLALVSSALILLALMPVWVEGELSTVGGPGLAAMHGHDLPAVLTSIVALYAFAVVSGTRLVIDFLRDQG